MAYGLPPDTPAPYTPDTLMENNVTMLGTKRALKAKDNTLWTPVECLQNVIDDIKSGEYKVDKLVVLRVNTKDGTSFDVGYHLCNMKSSELMATLEIGKVEALKDMGYLGEPS